jgi:Mg/Co/Ni transporter MgtE
LTVTADRRAGPGLFGDGLHWPLIALAVGVGLIGAVTFASLSGSMPPIVLTPFEPEQGSG